MTTDIERERLDAWLAKTKPDTAIGSIDGEPILLRHISAALSALPAATDARDAARYRWLRGDYIAPNGTLRVTENDNIPSGRLRLLALSLDDEVDIAMREAGK